MAKTLPNERVAPETTLHLQCAHRLQFKGIEFDAFKLQADLEIFIRVQPRRTMTGQSRKKLCKPQHQNENSFFTNVLRYGTLLHMDISHLYQHEAPVKATELSDWLLSHGVPAVTTKEAAALMGIPEDRVRQRLAVPRKKGRIATPSRGLWVPVPPDRSAWGAPEPIAYLDALMEHLRATYYVGWLSAAALHGASHQAPQVFQVAADKRIEDRQVGRSRLRFLTRSATGSIPSTRMTTPAGIATVSTPGATMLDVMEDLEESGGLDNAVTVAIELARENPEYLDDVLVAAPQHSDSAVRRLGWALDRIGGETGLDKLERAAAGLSSNPSLLSPHSPRTTRVDDKWNLNVNKEVDPDL